MINKLFQIIEAEGNKVDGSIVRLEADDWYGSKVVVERNNKKIEFIPFSEIGLSNLNRDLMGLDRFKPLDFVGITKVEGQEFNFIIENGKFTVMKFTERFFPSKPPVVLKGADKFKTYYKEGLNNGGNYIMHTANDSIADLIKAL